MALDDFTLGDSSESTSDNGDDEPSENKRTSQMFTKDRFEEVLDETEYDWEQKDYDWTQEWVYETESEDGHYVMRIFSSVDKRSSESREKDSDAIRLVVIHEQSGWPVLKEKRTNRIKTWPKNLKKKIRRVKDRKDEVNVCEECRGVMLIKKNKDNGDKFLGCVNYPDCKNTDSLN